jgi:hypothetical protein
MEYCVECGDPILPGDGIHYDLPRTHEECWWFWLEREDRCNFWFDYVMPEDYCVQVAMPTRIPPLGV